MHRKVARRLTLSFADIETKRPIADVSDPGVAAPVIKIGFPGRKGSSAARIRRHPEMPGKRALPESDAGGAHEMLIYVYGNGGSHPSTC